MALGGSSGGGGGASAGAVRAGRAFVEIAADDSLLEQGLKAVQSKLQSFGKTVRNVGLGVAGAGSVVLAPIAAAFGEMLSHFADVNKAAGRLFTTPEVASGLAYALGGLEEMEHAARHLQRAIAENKPAFAELGLSAESLKGLALDQQFLAVGDALDGVTDNTKKVQVAFELLGRQGAALASKLSGGGIRAKLERASLLGEIVTKEDAERAQAITKEISDFHKAVQNTWRAVGAAILGVSDTFVLYTEKVIAGLKVVRDWINANRQLVLTVAAVAAGVVAAGTGIAALGLYVQVAARAFGFLAAAAKVAQAAVSLTWLTALGPVSLTVGLTAAAVAGLVALWGTQTEAGREFFRGLAETAVESFGAISHALTAGRIDLAWKVLTTALNLEWQRFAGSLGGTLVEAFHDMIYVVQNLWGDFTTGLLKKTIDLAQGVREAFGSKALPNAAGFLGAATGLPVVGAAVGGALETALANNSPDAIKKALDEANTRAAAARDKEFDADKEKRKAEREERLKAAKEEFEKAKAAALAAEIPGKKGKESPVPGEAQTYGGAAGAFQAASFRQLLGGNDTAKKQLDVLKDIRDRIQAGGVFL